MNMPILKIPFLATAALCLTMAVSAQAADNGNQIHLATNQAKETLAKKILHIQDFKKGDLSIQFRYVNKRLEHMRLMNTGKESMEVNVLNEHYILGPGDSLLLDPPSVKYLKIHHRPHSIHDSTVSKMMKDRFGTHTRFTLPENSNGNVDKSVTKPSAVQ